MAWKQNSHPRGERKQRVTEEHVVSSVPLIVVELPIIEVPLLVVGVPVGIHHADSWYLKPSMPPPLDPSIGSGSS